MILLELPEHALSECLLSLRYHLNLIDDLVVKADANTWDRWTTERSKYFNLVESCIKPHIFGVLSTNGEIEVKTETKEVDEDVKHFTGSTIDIDSNSSHPIIPKISNTYSVAEGSDFLPRKVEQGANIEQGTASLVSTGHNECPEKAFCIDTISNNGIGFSQKANCSDSVVLTPVSDTENMLQSHVSSDHHNASNLQSQLNFSFPSINVKDMDRSLLLSNNNRKCLNQLSQMSEYGKSPRPFGKSLFNRTKAGPQGKLQSVYMPKPSLSKDGHVINKCHICQNVFSSHYKLKRHLRRHAGVRPFSCNLCGKCFFQVWDLKRHRTAVHAENGAFLCGICGKAYNYPTNLRIHERSHSKTKNITDVHDEPMVEDTQVGLLESIQNVVLESIQNVVKKENEVVTSAGNQNNPQQLFKIQDAIFSVNSPVFSTTLSCNTSTSKQPPNNVISNNTLCMPFNVQKTLPTGNVSNHLKCNNQSVGNLTYIQPSSKQNFSNFSQSVTGNQSVAKSQAYFISPQMAQSNVNVPPRPFQPMQIQQMIIQPKKTVAPSTGPVPIRPAPPRLAPKTQLNVPSSVGSFSLQIPRPPPLHRFGTVSSHFLNLPNTGQAAHSVPTSIQQSFFPTIGTVGFSTVPKPALQPKTISNTSSQLYTGETFKILHLK